MLILPQNPCSAARVLEDGRAINLGLDEGVRQKTHSAPSGCRGYSVVFNLCR